MQSTRFLKSIAKRFWISLSLVVASFGGLAAAPAPFETTTSLAKTNKIDELVFAQLEREKILPANLCSDAVFVRRVYLDVIGTLPTAFEAENFILDQNPNKRAGLVDQLLKRDEFADYWAMKWGDLLRVKAEFPINLWPNAAQAYHHWLRDAIRTNMPYNKFARDLLTSSGGNFENPPVNFYRALQNKTPLDIGQAVALTFMGARAENWPSNEQANLAMFFANVGYKYTGEWKEEIVFFNPASTNTDALNGSSRTAFFPGGSIVALSPDHDPRVVFADWLVAPNNPWFARNIVNRVWSWLLGRGIIQEPDDIRADNSPNNPQLLAYLEKELIASNYDLKHVFRLILNSRTYQLSAIPQKANPNGAANFASYPLRRLDAEVLIDAIDQITGTTESYSSAIPEPYTFVPDNLRSIALPDGSISSPFLETFGRPARDTGHESERNNRITAAQKLWLLNSSQLQRKLEQSKMISFQTQPNKTPPQIISAMYLGILSRFPTAEEAKTAQAYFQKTDTGRRQATVDLAWALMNTTEFLYRH
jgi:hypothetical protein